MVDHLDAAYLGKVDPMIMGKVEAQIGEGEAIIESFALYLLISTFKKKEHSNQTVCPKVILVEMSIFTFEIKRIQAQNEHRF